MIFEWDPAKSESNRKKHAIDFQTAKGLWRDEFLIKIHAPHPVENRSIVIGQLHGKLWTAIYTMRGDAVRIVSVRRSRKKEVKLYEKEKTG
ncbi:MAG: BrnT family toxin [Nitrospirae bacterium]|nr:BrnT family toxin [Nitrospirota bacterium]